MRRAALLSGLILAVLACTKSESTQPQDGPDPLAGRTRHTIVYGGNLWGDLLECG